MSALAEETKDDAPVPPGSPTKRHASASIDVDEEEEARVNKLLASGDAEEEVRNPRPRGPSRAAPPRHSEMPAGQGRGGADPAARGRRGRP